MNKVAPSSYNPGDDTPPGLYEEGAVVPRRPLPRPADRSSADPKKAWKKTALASRAVGKKTAIASSARPPRPGTVTATNLARSAARQEVAGDHSPPHADEDVVSSPPTSAARNPVGSIPDPVGLFQQTETEAEQTQSENRKFPPSVLEVLDSLLGVPLPDLGIRIMPPDEDHPFPRFRPQGSSNARIIDRNNYGEDLMDVPRPSTDVAVQTTEQVLDRGSLARTLGIYKKVHAAMASSKSAGPGLLREILREWRTIVQATRVKADYRKKFEKVLVSLSARQEDGHLNRTLDIWKVIHAGSSKTGLLREIITGWRALVVQSEFQAEYKKKFEQILVEEMKKQQTKLLLAKAETTVVRMEARQETACVVGEVRTEVEKQVTEALRTRINQERFMLRAAKAETANLRIGQKVATEKAAAEREFREGLARDLAKETSRRRGVEKKVKKLEEERERLLEKLVLTREQERVVWRGKVVEMEKEVGRLAVAAVGAGVGGATGAGGEKEAEVWRKQRLLKERVLAFFDGGGPAGPAFSSEGSGANGCQTTRNTKSVGLMRKRDAFSQWRLFATTVALEKKLERLAATAMDKKTAAAATTAMNEKQTHHLLLKNML